MILWKTTNKAIELNPKDAMVWIYKGQVLEDMGNFDATKVAYDRAIDLNPKIRIL